MATLAIDRPRPPLADFVQLLAPAPGRLEFAARLALLCALTTWIVEYYQTPAPALTTYIVFFMLRPDRTTSVILSAALGILITIVTGSLMLVAMTVVDYPGWRVAAMVLISLALTFAASASKLKPVANIVALICAYGLDQVGNFQIGELATRGLLYAWLFVGIPAGLSIALNPFLAPAPRRLAEVALAGRLRLSAAMLREPDAEARTAFAESLDDEPGKIAEWVKLAGVEKTSPPADIAALNQAAHASTAVMLLVDFIARNPEAALPAGWRAKLANTLDEMAAIFLQGGYPVEISIDPPDETTPLSRTGTAVLAELRSAIVDLAVPPPPQATPSPPAKPEGGFFLPDAFNNPEHIQYAIKATAAAMFCYVTYSLLDWPGIHTCLITCYIVSLGTTAETVEKLTLRVLGCLIGAAAGLAAIIFLIPDVTWIGTLMVVVFVAAFASAWIAAGSPRISYVGFQIAFAFFLCVIQGPSPAFDLTVARDRVIGILFGNLTVFVLFTTLWPVSVTKRIDGKIASMLRRLASIARAPGKWQRYPLTTDTRSALSEARQDCDLAIYEPAAIRRSQDWLDRRRGIIAEAAALEAPLLVSAAEDEAKASSAATRLMQFADMIEHPHRHRSAPADTQAASTTPTEAIGKLVDLRIANLERLIDRSHKTRGVDHAPA